MTKRISAMAAIRATLVLLICGLGALPSSDAAGTIRGATSTKTCAGVTPGPCGGQCLQNKDVCLLNGQMNCAFAFGSQTCIGPNCTMVQEDICL